MTQLNKSNAKKETKGKIPNRATVKAMRDANARRTYKAKNVDSLLKDIRKN